MEILYDGVSRRLRPEDVADQVLRVFAEAGEVLDSRTQRLLERRAQGSLRRRAFGYSAMVQDFTRPVGVQVQVRRAEVIFDSGTASGRLTAEDCLSPEKVAVYVRALGAEIHKAYGRSDFRYDRLNGEARDAAGLQTSRRKYNRKFRFLARMERKVERLAREWRKYEYTRIGKSGLATRLSFDDFAANINSACFIAYYASRCNLRSEFTIAPQQRPMDGVAEALLERCKADAGAHWWAIAHVYPERDVLRRLDASQRGQLLAIWYRLLREIAALLCEVWETSRFDLRSMVVKRGDDSSTWNNTASAWNMARKHWVALLFAMGMEDMLEGLCLGKVPRLIAADVASWHRSAGRGLHPDTHVWADLPYPWRVLDGQARCSRDDVLAACARHGVDPERAGWVAPQTSTRVERFRPTPELVNGVAVRSPQLAYALRRAGYFSGKALKGADLGMEAGEALRRHREKIERKERKAKVLDVPRE